MPEQLFPRAEVLAGSAPKKLLAAAGVQGSAIIRVLFRVLMNVRQDKRSHRSTFPAYSVHVVDKQLLYVYASDSVDVGKYVFHGCIKFGAKSFCAAIRFDWLMPDFDPKVPDVLLNVAFVQPIKSYHTLIRLNNSPSSRDLNIYYKALKRMTKRILNEDFEIIPEKNLE